MTRLIALLFFVAVSWAQIVPTRAPWNRLEFIRLNGKRADPCHIALNRMNTDCPYNRMPDSSNTILAPVVTSNGQAATFYTADAQRSLVITGHFLTGITGISLSDIGGRCSRTVLPVTATTTATTVTFTVPLTWLATSLELEEKPRSICYTTEDAPAAATRWIYTGFHWKVVWSCDLNTNTRACPPPTFVTSPAATPNKIGADGAGAAGADAYGLWPMNETYIMRRLAMTTCCINTVGSGNWQINQCINPREKTCCGSSAVEKSTAKCCQATAYETSQWNDLPCPCYQSTVGGAHCPTGETCCLPSKYPELSLATNTDLHGECYNATGAHQCCDTGKRFDPGSEQCCVVNGVQSLDVPCPCGVDTDCKGNWADATDDSSFICCRQNSPVPWESVSEATTTNPKTVCNKYANYPEGTGHYAAQPCLGNCIDRRYQICCNGAACMQDLEYCCNSTCCNRFVGTCSTGRRPGAPGAWQNPKDFGMEYIQCSTIEQMNPIKAFWIFVLPTQLMFATFVGLAITMAFAARATDHHSFSILETIMIMAAFLTILFAITLFFAPVYKYGIAVVISALFAIVTASARVRWLNAACIFVQLVVLFYLFDFVHGNAYLNLSSNRVGDRKEFSLVNATQGNTDSTTMGILHSTRNMFASMNAVKTERLCTTYYDYFLFDNQIRDYERFDNPEVSTFGYCSRAWVVALYLFEAAILDLVLLQTVLSLLVLIKRFRRSLYDPVVLTVMEGKEPAY